MNDKELMYWWLDNLEGEGQEPDPTHLMQAFSLTRKKATEVIEKWLLAKGDDNEDS